MSPCFCQPSRFRRWLKRALWSLAVLVVLLVAFHRPILRFAADWGVRRLADQAGYELEWELGGGFLSDVSVKRLRLKGAPGSALTGIEWSNATAEYSLWNLFRKGPSEFLSTLKLDGVRVELDLRSGRVPPPDRPEAWRESMWIGRLELHGANARILSDGGETLVRGLSLVIDEHAPGYLIIEEILMPSPRPHLTNVRGKTNITGRTLGISNLVITTEVMVPRLELGLGALNEGTIPLRLEVRSGEGTLQVAGVVDKAWDEPTLNLSLTLHHLDHTDVSRWITLPADMTWHVDDAEIQVRGPPRSPQKLSVNFSLNAADLQLAGVRLDSLQTRAALDGGALKLETLSLRSGRNGAHIQGTAALPLEWRQMRTLSTDLQWQVDAPDMALIFIDPTRYSGSLRGNGTVSLKDGRLAGANAALEGTNLKLLDRTIASLSAKVSTDATVTRVESLVVQFDAQNTIKLSGEVRLTDGQPTHLSWKIEARDLAALARWSAIENFQPPDAGRLTASGTADFSLARVMKDGLEEVKASGGAVLDGLVWQRRRIEKASLQATLEHRVIDVMSLDVRLDEANHAHFTGSLSLIGAMPARLMWQVDFLNLAVASEWLTPRDLPPIAAGKLITQGEASGDIADILQKHFARITTDGEARLDGLEWHTARMESAVLKFAVRGGRADVKRLEARFDAGNVITAKGHLVLDEAHEFEAEVSGALNRLTNVSGWFELANAPRITSGRADFSWKAKGRLSPRDFTGSATVNVTDLRREGSTDAFSLAFEARHAGRRAEIAKLQISGGGFRGEATGSISDTDLSIPRVTIFSRDLQLVDGSVQLPLLLAQKPRPAIPIDPKRPLAIKLRMDKLDIAKLMAVVGQKPAVSGVVSAEVEIGGRLAEVAGKALIQVQKFRASAAANKLEPASLHVNATLARGRIDITASARQQPLQTATATAALPFDLQKVAADPDPLLDAPLTARIILPRSNLAVMRHFVPALASIDGTMSADVQVSGSLRKPEWSGVILADAPRAAMKDSDMDIRDAKVRATFRGQRITLDDVSASLSGGGMRLKGAVELTRLADPKLDLQLEVRESLIARDETMSLRADGSLTITGAWSKADVAGRVELVRGRIFKEIEFLPLSLPDQLPPPPPLVPNAKTPVFPPPFGPWNFNVDIVTRDPIRLLGNVLSGGATADFHLSGTGAAPVLEGKFSGLGARLQLPFSGLELSRSDVIYTKDKLFVPQLDLQGESVVGNYQVTVYATGPAAKPKLRFTSSPPLTEPEIATLLATGTAAGDAQSASGVAANRVAFLVLSKAYRKLFNKNAPTRQNVQPGPASFSLNPLSSGASLGRISGMFEITPNWQAEIALADRGFLGMLSYLVRFR